MLIRMPRRPSTSTVAAIAKIAKDQGVTIRLEVDGAIVIIPRSTNEIDEEAELDRELAEYRRKHGYG